MKELDPAYAADEDGKQCSHYAKLLAQFLYNHKLGVTFTPSCAQAVFLGMQPRELKVHVHTKNLHMHVHMSTFDNSQKVETIQTAIN